MPAQLLYGRILLSQGKLNDFQKWQFQLSTELTSTRQYWELCGDSSRLDSQYADAANCYWKALSIEDWESPSLLQGLYMSLQSSGRSSDAQKVLERLELATQAKEALQGFLNGSRSRKRMRCELQNRLQKWDDFGKRSIG